MRATPNRATLPQLIVRYRAVATGEDGILNELILNTYQSTAIKGSSLTWPQTRHLLHTHKLIPYKALTIDQWRMIDHHQALEQIQSMTCQHESLNRIALKEVAATLMRQPGGPTHSLLNRNGELRLDSAMAGRRALVAAHKLPAAINELFKCINTR